MAQFPALPLFTDAYLADAGHLPEVDHGRYLLLLIHMWRAPQCRLPNDDKWLARRFRKTVEEVQSDLRPIISEFMQTDGNWICQKRLLREWQWCHEKIRVNTASAKSRWQKGKGASKRISKRNAPYPTLPLRKENSQKKSQEALITSDEDEALNTTDDFDEFWRAYPRRAGVNARFPARQAFVAAVNAGTDPKAIIAGARAYAAAAPTEIGTKYIKQALRWLMERGWEDYAPVSFGRTAEAIAEDERRAKIYWLNQEKQQNGETG